MNAASSTSNSGRGRPDWRTIDCSVPMSSSSRPERTRSLATRDVEARDVDLVVQAALDLGCVRRWTGVLT
jgi:hypothetical protein